MTTARIIELFHEFDQAAKAAHARNPRLRDQFFDARNTMAAIIRDEDWHLWQDLHGGQFRMTFDEIKEEVAR